MNKSHVKWILLAVAVIVAISFFTNPDQATHLKTLNDTLSLRHPASDSWKKMLPFVKYHNYLIFSTTTAPNVSGPTPTGEDTTLSRGYFGRVETTEDIKILIPNVH
jgi:hypothetical protein